MIVFEVFRNYDKRIKSFCPNKNSCLKRPTELNPRLKPDEYSIEYLDFFSHNNEFFVFVREHFGNSLKETFDNILNQEKDFPLRTLLKVIFNLLKAVSQFEKENIILTTLEPKVIFSDPDDNIKISNYIFDYCHLPYEVFKFFYDTKYLPPEMLFYPTKNPVSSSVIWSIGIITLELISSYRHCPNLFACYNKDDFFHNYVNILRDYKDSTLIDLDFDSESHQKNHEDPDKKNIELFYHGKFIKKELLDSHPEIISFLKECLIIDCDNRKKANELLSHELFKEIQNEVKTDEEYTIFPINETQFNDKVFKFESHLNSKFSCSSSRNNYEILTNIFKLDKLSYLKQRGAIQQGPEIFNIPSYFEAQEKEAARASDQGSLIFVASETLELSSNITDRSKFLQSFEKYAVNPDSDTEKEVEVYFQIKYLIGSLLYKMNNVKKEQLLAEIKKSLYSVNNIIPPSYRKFCYYILLDIDYFNDRDNFLLAKRFPLSNTDIISDVEEEVSTNKNEVCSLISFLVTNIEKFIYTRQMIHVIDSILYLTDNDIEMSYAISSKFFTKFYSTFINEKEKKYLELSFHHLIIKRLVLYYDPELYIHLAFEGTFNNLFLTRMILSLFSLNFSDKKDLFKVWDLLIIENTNIIYAIVISIMLEFRSTLIGLEGEDILELFDGEFPSIKIDSVISRAKKIYHSLPQSFIPLFHEFNLDVISELQKNEFFKNRWWLMHDYYTEEITVPVITLEDVMKNFENALFVDIRESASPLKLKNSIVINDKKKEKADYYKEISMLLAKNENKFVVLVGDKETSYQENIHEMINCQIKMICVLQGGIDIIELEEKYLLN